jgi:DNA repair photolyase
MGVNAIQSKTILNKTKKRDDWFLDDYTLNPYSACSFNCLYCYIRGSKYGLNMAEKLAVKENAVELLDKQLALHARKNRYGFVVMSSATDPYLQVEKELGMTRKLLEVLLKHRFPVHIITKSDLVERDFDLLRAIGEEAILPPNLQGKLSTGVFITFSFSTLDDHVASVFEPGATPPSKRLKALDLTIKNGFKSGVSLMPLLPFISDSDPALRNMYNAFQHAGAHYVMPASLTLFGDQPHDSKQLMLRAIERHFPLLQKQYQNLFSDPIQLNRYHRELNDRTTQLNQKFKVPNRIA